MLSGTLRPSADEWVVVHLNRAYGGVNAVYGPFDEYIKAYDFRNKMPGDQSSFSYVVPVRAVG